MDDYLSKRTIHPERKYNISDAARVLGIHRATLYRYMTRFPNRIEVTPSPEVKRQYIKGHELLKFREIGMLKRGRKRKT